MRRGFAGSFLLVALAGGLRIPGLPWWGLALGLVVAGAGAGVVLAALSLPLAASLCRSVLSGACGRDR